MTRKDYILIARTLREDAVHLGLDDFNYASATDWHRGAYDQWSTTTLAIAKALQTEGGFDLNGNRRFKIDRFLDAAGLSGRSVAS